MKKEREIGNLRASMARHRITLKAVVENAGLDYGVIRNQLSTGYISHDRLAKLKKSLNELIDQDPTGRLPNNY